MSDLQTPDNTPSNQQLYAMSLVARMKDAADKHGIGFIGGFIAPDGTKFISTNMDPDDPNYQIPENLR